MGMIINPYLVQPSGDADAQAFITAAGITDNTQKSAIETLVHTSTILRIHLIQMQRLDWCLMVGGLILAMAFCQMELMGMQTRN